MRVMIKESYPLIRKGLIRLMNDFGACEITSYTDASGAAEALTQSDQAIDLLIFGMHADELDCIRRLLEVARKHQKKDIHLLVLSELPEQVYAPLSIAAGAQAFVSTRERVDVILAATKAMLLGGIYVSRELARHPIMRELVNTGELNVLDLLSCREREVAEYLLKDMPLQEISNTLNLSYTTVVTYRSRILKKLNVTQVSDFRKLAG